MCTVHICVSLSSPDFVYITICLQRSSGFNTCPHIGLAWCLASSMLTPLGVYMSPPQRSKCRFNMV